MVVGKLKVYVKVCSRLGSKLLKPRVKLVPFSWAELVPVVPTNVAPSGNSTLYWLFVEVENPLLTTFTVTVVSTVVEVAEVAVDS